MPPLICSALKRELNSVIEISGRRKFRRQSDEMGFEYVADDRANYQPVRETGWPNSRENA